MILGIDIGNTQIVAGLFSDIGEILLQFRVSSNEKLTEDEFFSYLKNISDFHNIAITDIKAIVVSSVVPNLTTAFMYLAQKYFNISPIFVSSDLKLPFKFHKSMENPKELGADRITNIVEAIKLFPDKNLLIIDFGTATTFDVIENKTYMGGAILPGVNLSINALFKSTSKLPKIRFEKPNSILGTNTIEHINSGIYYGTIGQIKEVITQIKKHIKNPYIITTGGLCEMISCEINEIDAVIPDLNLNGLFSIYSLSL